MMLVNGVECASVAGSDRGLAYGDGVFRTILVRHGIPQQLSRQLAKLAADCAAIGIVCPEERMLNAEVEHVVRSTPQAVLKVIITRGTGERGYRCSKESVPTRVIFSAALPKYPQTYASSGVKVCLCRLRLAGQPALAGIKHLNRLENVLARSEWDDSSIAEGILRDMDENVIGGTMTNLFVVRRGALATPRLDRCGVAGVTRERVIEAAARHGISCSVVELSLDDVLAGDELFLVNSVVGVWPVREIAGRGRAVGALARAAQGWLSHDDADAL